MDKQTERLLRRQLRWQQAPYEASAMLGLGLMLAFAGLYGIGVVCRFIDSFLGQ